MKTNRRRKLLVDPVVQIKLAFRTAVYWMFWVLTLMLMLLCWRLLTGPARPFQTQIYALWYLYGPAAIASFLLMPIVIVDSLKISNQIVGPIHRFRGALKSLADGERAEPIEFRNKDLWGDMAQEFNRVAERLKEAEVHKPDAEPALTGAEA